VPQEPEKPNPIQDLLSRYGFTSNLMQKVRFRGPVGKLALIGVVCMSGLGGVGIRTGDPYVAGLCAVLATIVALSVGAGILWYSDKHPHEATLEGMEVVVMQQHKAWAAKGWTGPGPDGLVIPDPSGSPPQLNPPLGADK
jgi:hypothetical protein